jgi:hypothetical protein
MEKNIIIENAPAIRAGWMGGLDLNDIGCSGNGKPKVMTTEGHPGRSLFDLNRDPSTAGEQWQFSGDWVAGGTQNLVGNGLRVRTGR